MEVEEETTFNLFREIVHTPRLRNLTASLARMRACFFLRLFAHFKKGSSSHTRAKISNSGKLLPTSSKKLTRHRLTLQTRPHIARSEPAKGEKLEM